MVTYQYIRFFTEMGRKRNTVPSRLHHRPSGQDRVIWNGRSIYLGRHDSPESEARYRKILRSILETGQPFPDETVATVATVAERYLVHTRKSFPANSREPMAYARAMALLTDALGTLNVTDMTPARFTAMRDAWAETNSVRTVNKHHNMVLACFRWAVTAELVPAGVWHALQAVPRLKPKRSPARDPRIVGPVAWKDVEAIRGHVRPQVWAMILVQWHTGMRSGEMLAMTPGQIVDWVYRPRDHKNAWRGHVREIPLGPQCREILGEWITGRDESEPVFPGYSSQSYGRAVSRACKAAGVPHWHPHQIRHAFATRVRESHGLDAAQAVLGHATARVTEIYAERSTGLARRVVDEIG
jgi:integrase